MLPKVIGDRLQPTGPKMIEQPRASRCHRIRRDDRTWRKPRYRDARGFRDGLRKVFNPAWWHRQAVISYRACVRDRALDDVEPIHLALSFSQLPFSREVTRAAETCGTKRQEITIKRQNNIGLVEVIDR